MSECILSRAAALAKRRQLIQDGFCVIPEVLTGTALTRAQDFTTQFLDAHPPHPRFRFQGTDFPIINEKAANEFLTGQKELGPDLARRPHVSCLADALLENPRQAQVCADLGLENMAHGNAFLILSKPAQGPALYWHQDHMEWNHPKSALPWPTRIFLSYYMVDTARHNGCLRVIPGTHRRRIALHDLLPEAHGQELQDAATTEAHHAFADHPDALDVAVAAGDLVIADNRVLHGAWPNRSDQRRPLLLQWWDVFPFPSRPSWWEGEVPSALLDAEGAEAYAGTREPTAYLPA